MMPITPDKLDVILGVVLEIRDKIAAAPPVGAPTESEDEATKFLARWKQVTATEFQSKYGVPLGQPIPAMVVYDEAEAIYRARAGYGTYGKPGRRWTTPDIPVAAVNVIAHATPSTATQFYECGGGKALQCFPDTLAYGFWVGLLDTQSEYAASLGAGTQPSAYAGVTLEHLLGPNFSGGSPSGGG